MIPLPVEEPWERPLFAEAIPVEIVLRLAHVFCDQPATEEGNANPERDALDLTILRMLAVEAFRRGADYRELPWAARLEHVQITGQPERQQPRRPKAPDNP